MALEFIGDAISLSGLTGSKIKSEIIGEYYPFWWNITSGGERSNHNWPTAIVELDAATGEMYIKDTKETILGSSGHALALKNDNYKTRNLKIVLIERNGNCYSHLKNVIHRRWPSVNIDQSEGPILHNQSGIFLINKELDEAVITISKMNLGNSLFFFDPLRGVPFDTIDKVASVRINNYYQIGTEFIIFIFTSDWFLGRDDFIGLPYSSVEESWTEAQCNTVREADSLFGNKEWRGKVLIEKPVHEREYTFIEEYKQNLHKWFRYVLPMPFNPKGKQIFHLILCSNFEVGVRATKGFFCERTNNLDYKPDNKVAYEEFRKRHPEIMTGLRGNQRPKEWKLLWKTITQHEEGFCDCKCRDFEDIEPYERKRGELLAWLANKDYLLVHSTDNPWNIQITQHKVNWQNVKETLNIDEPQQLEPLSLRRTSLEEISR